MNRNAVIPLLSNQTLALDSFFHLKKLFLTDITDDMPAFSYLERGMLKCVTYDIFTKRLKALLALAGYAPELYSGHSMQRGGGVHYYFSWAVTHCSYKLWVIGLLTNF